MTPLYWAVALGQLSVVTMLVDRGARANVSPKVSMTAQFNSRMGANEVTNEHVHPLLYAVHLLEWSEDLTRCGLACS